jgi:NAD(P)-dependent dehydrogenase (short-subunit alcohol dehydrogenase family)
MPTILITGANRGIGLELCRQYAARGGDVIAVCRHSSDELDALGVQTIIGVDVADGETMAHLREAVGNQRIDVLINNAGILRRETLGEIDYDDMLLQYQVNTLGPLRVTEALLGNLVEGSKVAIVTSRVGSIADNSSGGNYGYRASKTAVNMIGTNLMHDLRPRGIAVALLHPGYVETDMSGGQGMTTPPVSAAGLIERIDELTLETSGGFWHAEGYELPW